MKSPFKFLDPFLPDEQEIFFGRDQEVEDLYELVYKSRFLLVYGQSGTGKTSLVQCGLGGRFEDTDWFPLWIRRNENINDALKESLAAPLGGELRKGNLVETIRYLYRNFLRPVYLIFDQLEELFILGKEQEQIDFIQNIKNIHDAELPCKILWVMREEYIAELYHFEQVIPSLFNRRFRVEPMSLANVEKVIRGSCESFSIDLENPKESVKLIIQNISKEKSGIQLPYLQVYLDTLWQEDFHRTYPGSWEGTELPKLEFTLSEIQELGDIEDVLEKFLRQQSQNIEDQLKTSYPNLPENAVRQVIDVFVTEEGTKRPIGYRRESQVLILDSKWQEELKNLPSQEILKELDKARILRFSENQIELAHDSLADLIDRDRSDEQRQLNQAKRRIAAAYLEHRETGEFLSSRQLASLEEMLPRLSLEENLLGFIANSYHDVEREEQEIEKQRLRELNLVEEKLAVERKSARRQRITLIFTIIALVISVILGIYNRKIQLDVEEKAKQISKQNEDLKAGEKVILEKRDSLTKALEEIQKGEAIRVISEAKIYYSKAKQMQQRGYPAVEKELLQKALELYRSFESNPKLKDSIASLEKRLKE